jgi:hypothetical protein
VSSFFFCNSSRFGSFDYPCSCQVLIEGVSRVELTTANHVHLVEPHWSPMAEAQAIDRVHRIGQTRDVMVTRYIVSGTIENVCRP